MVLYEEAKNINFQEYIVEGENHSFAALENNVKKRRMFVQAVLAVVNQPRIKSVWSRLPSDAWFDMVLVSYNEQQGKVLSGALLPPLTTLLSC